jgi:hypothetical protein
MVIVAVCGDGSTMVIVAVCGDGSRAAMAR